MLGCWDVGMLNVGMKAGPNMTLLMLFEKLLKLYPNAMFHVCPYPIFGLQFFFQEYVRRMKMNDAHFQNVYRHYPEVRIYPLLSPKKLRVIF